MNNKNIKRLEPFNVFSDSFAKSLLRSKEMRPVLAHVLSILTGFSESDILKANFEGGELPKDNVIQKGQIADIVITLDDKRSIIIEINQGSYPELINKNGYYAMKVALLKRTSDVTEPEVWLVNIDKYLLKPEVDETIQYFEVLERTKGLTREFTGYKSVHLPIDYIIGNGYNGDEKLYRFAQLFNATTLKEVKEICEGDEDFMPICKKIEKLTSNQNFVIYHNWEEEQEILRRGRERYAEEQGLERGLKQGIEQGLIQGIEKGIEQGLEQGIEQGIEQGQTSLINTMLSTGMSKGDISKHTRIPLEQISKMVSNTKICTKTR